MSLWVVVGGQYGSEGKGKISAYITQHENIDICVRCGGPNSGHSFVDDQGKTIVLRQLPTGFVNQRTRLLIPAGALIDPLVLKQEIDSLQIPPKRIGIDPNCFIIEERDRETERALELRKRLSSTLCGVGSAVSRRVLRGADARLVKDVVDDFPWLGELIARDGASAEVNAALDQDKKVLIEGTQGFGLSLYHSEYYPHCTSRDTTAGGFLSEVGVSPRLVTEVVVVFRTFPIRVAGAQAGFMRDEITWKDVREISGYTHDVEERTTVTKKVRRIAKFDWDLAFKATRLNRPTKLAVNCLDYLDVANSGCCKWELLTEKARDFIFQLETRVGAPVCFAGTGPALSEIVSRETAALCPSLVGQT
jgi:adenylosuccinate synthase